MVFPRINGPILFSLHSKGQSGTKILSLFVYAGLTPQAHLLNRKAAALHFMCVYTGCSQYAITKYWQKAVCPTNPTITYCSFSCNTCFTFNRGTIYRDKNWYKKSLGVRRLRIPPLNDAPGWGSTLSPFLFALQLISNCYTSCHGKCGCLLYAGKNVVTEQPQHTIA